MFKSILKFVLKRLFRFEIYSFINIIGLAIGMASFILIALYVYDEYSYDKYHSKVDRIYRITSILDFNGVGEKSSSQPFPMGQAIMKDYPEYVESYVRFFNMQKSQVLVSNKNKLFNETRFFYCDSNVFDVFDFKLIKGNKEAALNKPFSIVITESTAKRYFEDVNPIGKTLKVDKELEFEVTGIVKDVLPQSHFKFDFLASFSSLPYLFKDERILKDWIWNPCWTYLLLKEQESSSGLQPKLQNFVQKHIKFKERQNYQIFIQPLTEIHLNSKLDYEIEKNGNGKYVRFLMILGILILIIASLNFINLSTASAARRIKEIGIRKVSGASKTQLIFQLLTESLFVTLLSLMVAITLVELFLPIFSQFSGKIISTDFRFRKETLLGIFCLWFFTGIISGLYPAIYLASLKASNLIRRNLKFSTNSTKFRKILVLVQYSISIILIITTFGVFRQLRYLHNADLGFKKANIIIIDAGFEVSSKYSLFKEELLKDKNIKNVTAMNYIIGSSYNTYPFNFEGSEKKDFQFYPAIIVRDDFIKTFEIEILAGRDFSEDEKNAGSEILVNEEMVKYLGFKKNEDLIGKTFYSARTEEKVVGVFSNMNVSSLHHKVEPFIINMPKDSFGRTYESKYIVIRTDQNNIDKSVATIEKTWENMGFERPFEYKFLSDILDMHYKGEDFLGDFARIFTLLSIVISLLGIWGLTAYITEYRTREIGIRKVLGATLLNIIALINKEFIFVMAISLIISWPLAYYVLSGWINNFAYTDFLNLWSFILSSMLAIFIALITISHKAIGAGKKNPIDAIRYE